MSSTIATAAPTLSWDGHTYDTMQLTIPSGESHRVTESLLSLITSAQWGELHGLTKLRIDDTLAQAILDTATAQ